MAITKADIKLMAPQVLADTPDGGGQMTGNEIVDGSVNNLFPDMSHLDKMTGRVSMRKCFPAILTDDNDTYYGMHVVLTDPPDDPDVTVCMMTTDSYIDRREDARDRVESYVAAGPRWPGYLYGTQYEGSRTVVILQREETALPEIGEVRAGSLRVPPGGRGSSRAVRPHRGQSGLRCSARRPAVAWFVRAGAMAGLREARPPQHTIPSRAPSLRYAS